MNVGDLVKVAYPKTSYDKFVTGVLIGFSRYMEEEWVIVEVLDNRGPYRIEVIPRRVEVLSESR